MNPLYVDNGGETIYFTMSLWNPYDVYVVKATLEVVAKHESQSSLLPKEATLKDVKIEGETVAGNISSEKRDKEAEFIKKDGRWYCTFEVGCGSQPEALSPPATKEPFLRVLYPNGGETIERLKEFEISWTSEGIGDRIQIHGGSDSNPGGWYAVADDTENDGKLDEALQRFGSLRTESTTWLRSLDNPDWNRSHEHPKFGPFRADDILAAWVAHDYVHLHQIAKRMYQLAARDAGEYSIRYAGEWGA